MTIGRSPARRSPQKEHDAFPPLATARGAELDDGRLRDSACSATATQPSQMYTLGPLMSFDTSLGGRPQNVHTASLVRGFHHEPPASSTIC